VALRAYQVVGAHFLASRNSALLADEMGLGKTVQAIFAIQDYQQSQPVCRVLIVVPTSLKLNWKDEFSRWAPDIYVRLVEGNKRDRRALYMLPIPVLIASYEQIRIDSLSINVPPTFDLVVLDEAQRIKNSASSTASACRLLSRNSSWALTGTPVENRPSDLTSIMQFVDKTRIFDDKSKVRIQEQISGIFLRRRKKEVLKDLPPIVSQDLTLELSHEQRLAYDEIWETRNDRIDSSDQRKAFGNILALITELKKICNFVEDSDTSTKLEALQLIIENVTSVEDKLIVFSQYVSTLKRIKNNTEFSTMEIYSGELSTHERSAVVGRFNDLPGPRVLLVSLKAGGVGLNLPEASTVVLFDRWWNPAVEDQAIQRAHRFGRKSVLHVVRFLVRDTIEERIDSIINEKREIFSDYIDDMPDFDSRIFTNSELRSILDLEKKGLN